MSISTREGEFDEMLTSLCFRVVVTPVTVKVLWRGKGRELREEVGRRETGRREGTRYVCLCNHAIHLFC